MSATQQPDAPGAESETTARPRARGGFWKRFAASLVDGLIITACTVPVVAIDVSLYYAVNLIGQIAYYTVLEGGSGGQTLGKMLLGLRVVDLAHGGPIGYARGFIRWIGRLPSFMVFLLGYLWMLWDPEKQTWHDKLASAVVVPSTS